MRTLQASLTLAVFVGCNVTSSPPPEPPSRGDGVSQGQASGSSSTAAGAVAGVGEGGAGCAPAGDPWSVENLTADLTFLSSSDIGGRVPASPGSEAAHTFVADRFRCLGLQPGGADGSFFQPFKDSEKDNSSNIVGILPGSDPAVSSDVIVIGAHIDHFGRSDQEECKGLCLGANDNASGVGTVLAIARAMKQRPTPPRRTLAFVIFDSEERGCDGSHFFVDDPLASIPIERVVYDINIDMVGTYTQWGKHIVAHGTVSGTPGLAEIQPLVGPSGLNVEINVPGIDEDDSDYYPFCAKGIPMVSFFTHDPSCYHESCDTIEKIDFPNLSTIVKLSSDLAGRLGDTQTDLAAFRNRARAADLGCSGYKNPAGDDDDDN